MALFKVTRPLSETPGDLASHVMRTGMVVYPHSVARVAKKDTRSCLLVGTRHSQNCRRMKREPENRSCTRCSSSTIVCYNTQIILQEKINTSFEPRVSRSAKIQAGEKEKATQSLFQEKPPVGARNGKHTQQVTREGVLLGDPRLRTGGTLATKSSSGDSSQLKLFKMLAQAQLETALEAAIISCFSSQSPAWPRWLGIYAPLCQASLMNRIQDGSEVNGIHLTETSTFSFKSLLMLAAVCSLVTAWPGPGCSISEPPSRRRACRAWQGLEEPLQPSPQMPSLLYLAKLPFGHLKSENLTLDPQRIPLSGTPLTYHLLYYIKSIC
ncbi:uncharacterized protein [Symphalangus syndactylus]|uniref:uncharacterized protein n=1 Tax=Symphalangus syndactylus TaxID=9590 RepID=UPI0024419A44|nr:uncharacterized protein LOC129479692 [Symphalangus syndactylus]